jgi:hypothetical protein
MKSPSSASPSMNDQPSRLLGHWKRRAGFCTRCGAAGSRRAANTASSENTARMPKIARGPIQCAINAPSGSASTGPMAMNARDRPLRRAAPIGSAVASACVDRLSAAKHRPHISRSGKSAQKPESVA